MKKSVKNIIKKTVGPHNIQTFRSWRGYILWNIQGKPVPAHGIYKWKILKQTAEKYGIRTFIETGTAGGGTIEKMSPSFDRLYSIELDPVLYELGQKRIGNNPKVTLLKGDSGVVLKDILSTLSTPALFWLDAHYSGTGTAKAALDTPIVEELLTIFAHQIKNHVVVIDDMREFNGTHDYPHLSELKKIVAERAPEYTFSTDNDLMIIAPKSQAVQI